jgi:hypothetical protein
MDRRIPRNHWVEDLQAFTNRNAGRFATLEVSSTEIGAQSEEVDVPLRGVAFDPRDGRVEIMLGEQGRTERHLTHSVSFVKSIDVLRGSDGRDQALRIVNDDAQTLLRFVLPE